MNIGRNILAVLLGGFIGGAVNMAIINFSGSIIPYPEGYDMRTPESIEATAHLLESRHFILPYVAHAGGTLVGAIIAALVAASHKMKFALAIGAFFLVGGIMACFMIPAPAWFLVLDLATAYIPMGLLGGRIVGAKWSG